MKIIVLVKEVPDTYGARKLSLETGLTDRSSSDSVMDEISERALEVALRFADTGVGSEVVAMLMGPETASASLRKALAMGATSAVHIADEALVGADLGLTAEVLASSIKRAGFDLVVAGNQSTDGAGGVLPAMIAELLGVPQATALVSVQIDESKIAGQRATEFGVAQVSAQLPAVISITESMPEARFPGLKGIREAKRKPYETLSLADLDVDIDPTKTPRSIMIAANEKPARGAGVKIVDDGDAGLKLADFLLQNRLA
ncbi:MULTISPECIES: electron transfer flavoprotein subunit beta/FixA family protein [unclassified Arthrobacter]|uniref:electron transfer flavoprotein subunit beta/FixA family protein n=1 Tax=unclassified Arthrobacter TaxID=235627 RepID=UPI002882DD4F|nr:MULTISPECIES: electron transfer flavoprotein subunit beta/FixA family protein [unclassified Arthrobacter]